MSTHGCFAPPFPPFCTRLLRPDDGVQEPEDPDDVSTWSSASRSSWEVPGRRPSLFDLYYICASLLKANLFNLCMYSDNVASADSCVFEPSRPLACNIKLVLF